MKAILEFNLPEDQDDFDCAKNGSKWRAVASDLDEALRSKFKYSNIKWAGEVRTLLHEFIQERGLSLG